MANLLYNAQTGKPETLPEDQITQAVAAGTHAYRKGERVNVIDQDGQSQSVPTEQLKDAITQGYRLETPKEGAINTYVDENKGFGGAMKAFGAKALSEAAYGVPEIIYEKTGDPLEVAKYEALKKEHQAATVLGGATGMGASLLYGGPVVKGATKAGLLAEKAIAQRLTAAGVTSASKAAPKLVANMAAKAGKLGAEGAVYAAPIAITEAALGDPEAAAESLLWGVGIGSGLGLAGGVLSPAMNKLKEKAGQAKNLITQSAERSKVPMVPDAQVPGVFNENVPSDLLGAAKAKLTPDESLLEGLSRKKPNVDSIKASFDRFGLKPLEGAVSDNKLIQDLDSSLRKSVSPAGVRRAEEYSRVFDTVEDRLRRSFVNEAAPQTARDAGDKIRQNIIQKVESKYEPFNRAYETLRETTRGIQIPDERRIKFNDKIFKYRDENKAFGDQINKFAQEVIAEDSAAGVEAVIRRMKDNVNAANRLGRYEEQRALKGALDEAEDFLENEITRQAEVLAKEGIGEAPALAKEYLAQKAMVNKNYAGFKQFMETLGDVSKVRSKGTREFVNILKDDVGLASEKFAERLFDKKNSRALEFMKTEFPEAFADLVGQRKNEMIAKHTRDGQLQLGNFIREVDKMPPEIKKLILEGDQLLDFNASKGIIESLPKDVNPSGTARAMELNSFNVFNPNDYINAATRGVNDAAKLGFIRRYTDVDGILLAERAMKRSAEQLDRIPEILKGLGSNVGSKGVRSGLMIERLFSDGEKKEQKTSKRTREDILKELGEKNSYFAANPDAAIDKLAEMTKPIADGGAPNVSSLMSERISRAHDYLAQALPKPITPETPFFKPKWKVSDGDMASFERKLETIMEPFSVLDRLQDGRLTKDHIEALQAVYPRLASIMQDRILQTVTEAPASVSYQSRLKLSLLLGMNLDPSLQPSLMMNLASSASPLDAPQQGQGNPGAQSLTLADRTTLDNN